MCICCSARQNKHQNHKTAAIIPCKKIFRNIIYFVYANLFPSLSKGLAGKNKSEKARADMIAGGLLEPFPKFVAYFLEKDEAKKVFIFVVMSFIQRAKDTKSYVLVANGTLSGHTHIWSLLKSKSQYF